MNWIGPNQAHLDGELFRDAWSRQAPGGRLQVRFWLRLGGRAEQEGHELVLCAIVPTSNEELRLLEQALGDRRHVHGEARIEPLPNLGAPNERAPGVLFRFTFYEIGGVVAAVLPGRHHWRSAGKMAAAGDAAPELPLSPP